MTHFLKSGTRFNVTTKESMDLHETLPAGTYTVKFDDMAGIYYLDRIEDLANKGKIYGDTMKRVERILNTFGSRSGSTGVLLSGEKGSGKTLLAKMLSITGKERDIPTIVINQPWCGDGFNRFMQMIEQPTIVLFDEFEKVYEIEDQEKLLTLLDGVYPSKKLFVFTSNDQYRIDRHMQNRPGRIFYRLDYEGLDREFIVEYCEDNLENKEHIESICRFAVMFGKFNFDILKALVEEMNRYDESPQEAAKMLNAKPENGDAVTYTVTLHSNGVRLSEKNMEETVWRGNPLSGSNLAFFYKASGAVKAKKTGVDLFRDQLVSPDDSSDEWQTATFSVGDLRDIDAETGKFSFINDKGEMLTLVKAPVATYNQYAY